MQDITLPLEPFNHPALRGPALLRRLETLRDVVAPRLARYVGYYRNPSTDPPSVLGCPIQTAMVMRPYRQYQETGLPTRITGFRAGDPAAPLVAGTLDVCRKEVVIENDIAWRINTLVDFAVGQMPTLTVTVPDPARRATLNAALAAVLEASGGLALLQQLTLLGTLHGAAYLMLRPGPAVLAALAPRGAAELPPAEAAPEAGPISVTTPPESAPDLAAAFRLELVPASRVAPLPDADAPPGAPAWAHCAILHERCPETSAGGGGAGRDRLSTWRRVTRWLAGLAPAQPVAGPGLSFDLWGPKHWQRYVDGRLVDEAANPLGFVPVVAYLNQVSPPCLAAAVAELDPAAAGAPDLPEGLSEVEPLMALQDELNTRLSDRASRVTLQSFRMYLAKGVEDFASRPIGPGQMWSTANPEAKIESFGGDGLCPSEEAHIGEVRQALDKISGVPPVAAGLLRGRVGNLTSAVALRVTLIALLARTEKRRAALAGTLETLGRRILEVLDASGLLASRPEERDIEVHWASPLPENDMEKLQEAKLKTELGVPREVVLRELGYDLSITNG